MSEVQPLTDDPTLIPKLPDVHLTETDGEPLDSAWHRDEINLLVEQVRYQMRDRQDYFVGGNMFIYFSLEQARNRDFRGPDFFFVSGVPSEPSRLYWAVWEEDGKYPDVIIELLSPTTAREDRTTKKTIYEQRFRTPEYFLYDPDDQRLEGWILHGSQYQPIEPDERGWLWCGVLQAWLGTWVGPYQGCSNTWLRFYGAAGQVVPLFTEGEQQRADAEHQRADTERHRAEAERQRADAERQRAEIERQRADSLEAEVARLRAVLAEEKGGAGRA